MGVPNSEVGYTSAMPRREDHEVHKDMWGNWTKKKNKVIYTCEITHPHSSVDEDSGLLKIKQSLYKSGQALRVSRG